MIPSHMKELILPSTPDNDSRINQLQDEIDLCLVAKHFDTWAASRDIDTSSWTITYKDGGTISMSKLAFTCIIGNREIQVATLDEAEKWLWDNHSSGNCFNQKEQIPSHKITCGACTTAIGAHTYGVDCKLFGQEGGDS